jgi:hypothetical protein
MEHPIEFSPPAELLAEATREPSEFRRKTVDVLRVAGMYGSSNLVKLMQWPVGIWGTLCVWAEEASEGREDVSKKHATARDHLGALAVAHGKHFVWSKKEEDYVVEDIPENPNAVS